MQGLSRKRKATSSSILKTKPPSQDPDIAYQRTRDGFIEGLKVVKSATEATSFLGPLKAACEISLVFLETTRNIDENTKGLEQLKDRLSEHIDILEEGYVHMILDGWTNDGPDVLRDFDHALKRYISGLKDTLDSIDEHKHSRQKGVKGFLKKIADSKIEIGIIADYKQDIAQCTRVFEDATKLCQMQLQAEVWKMAKLGPEKPRPMGNQHKTCLPGTRGPILDEIRRWHKDPKADKRIFWLCDVGGSGKSTVALTICEEWDNGPNVVFGRFFFSKNARKTSETDHFCSVIADDIGSKSDVILEQVQIAKRKDPHLVERAIRHQFAKLIGEPLLLAAEDVVLVIDAVDECRKEMRGDLLRLLIEKISSMPRLKLFITSRPEPDIMAILQGGAIVCGADFEMHGKEEYSNLEDITAYAEAHLAKLLTAPERQRLVEHSNGLFIWITTANLELQQAQGPEAVESTLKSLLTRGKDGDINQVYTGILHRLRQERSLDVISKVMGTIMALLEPVSTEALAKLTGIEHAELERIVASMQSIFRVKGVVEFLHPTFQEFLVGSQNSDIQFETTTTQSNLAISILKILQESLKEDICEINHLGEPYPKNSDVPDLDERLQRVWASSPALLYSVKYWSCHISPVVTDENVAKALRTFLETCILHLIELLSLMSKIHLFRNFEEVRESLGSDTLEVELCRDAVRLVQRHQTVLEESALHIYSSALLFLPRKTKLWTTYGSKFLKRLPSIVGRPSDHWPSHQILTGHGNYINCVAISPNGTRMASGSDDKTLRLWDATTGASIGKLRGHTKSVTCLAFSPDESQIASGSWDGTLRLWDAISGASIAELKGHTKAVTCLEFSPDGLRLASGSQDASLRLWDVTNGASLKELIGHTEEVTCLAFSPTRPFIVSGSSDHTLRLWDAITGVSTVKLNGHTDAVTCLAFLPDGLRIVSGSKDHTLRLWDAITGTNITEMKGHNDIVMSVVSLPDGLRIASGSRDTTLRLWDTKSGAGLGELRGHTEAVMCLASSLDGLRIASGSLDHTLRLWETTGGANIGTLDGHTSGVTCLAFSPDGRYTASGSRDKSLRLWDVTSTASIGEFKGHTGLVICLTFSPDRLYIASGSEDHTLRVWDATTGAHLAVLIGHTSRVNCLAFSPDGLRLISASSDDTLRLWDIATASSLGQYSRVPGVRSLQFAEDGRSIQLDNGTVLDASQGRLQRLGSPNRAIAYSSSQHSNIYEQNNELWCVSRPHHRYRIPQEIKGSVFTKHHDKVAFGLKNGQVMVIDFGGHIGS